jgi:sugar/nucleoside kinase (ribokinase family)
MKAGRPAGGPAVRRPADKNIVCLGILVADVVGWPLQAIPNPGRLVLIDEMGLFAGGCAVNAATVLARFGLPVEIIGKIGQDPFGDFLLDVLARRGIRTQGIRRDERSGTSASMVLVEPNGERRFIHYIGANATLTSADIDLTLIENAALLHIGGALVLPGLDGEPLGKVLWQAQTAGVTTFLDTVWDDTGRWMELLAPCLPHIDVFVPSLPEAQALTGLTDPAAVGRALLEQGVGTVALKMGADGCLVMTEGESHRLPAYQVEVVDTTGAGDAFAAGFIAGVWEGLSLEETAHLANAAGALCVTGSGAAGGTRSLEETLKFMKTYGVTRYESWPTK